MATSDDNEPSFPAAVYQMVKDWAAQQEAFEKENKKPAPLTNIQRAFLEGLCTPPQPLENGRDYISVLNRYRQINPTGNNIMFIDGMHPIRNALGAPQWTSTVELSETSIHEPTIKSFPAASCCPPFAKKKDARKYAAKCAIDWLEKKSLLPPSLRAVASVAPTAETLSVLQSQSQPTKRPSEGTNGVLSPPPPKRKTQETTGAVDIDDESLPAKERVKAFCRLMKYTEPKYVCTLTDPDVRDVYDGHPDFGDDDSSFPEDLGRLANVSGSEENTKQKIAELLLVYLREEYRKRAVAHSELIGS